MSQQKQNLFGVHSAGSMDHLESLYRNNNAQQGELRRTKQTTKRTESNAALYDRLYLATFVQRSGEKNCIETGERKKRNEILSLANARLLKEKYLYSINFSRDFQLLQGILTSLSNEFVIVIRPDGRIIALTDEAEYQLGKTMRSLYAQCINIFECLDDTDGEKMRKVLKSSNDLTNEGHQLVCTFRLPKGKRPSRILEDVKTIHMSGHFYSNEGQLSEKLFIARCETLINGTTKGSSSLSSTIANQTENLKNTVCFVLREDLSVHTVSTNVREVLGYSSNEMSGKWFGRYIPSEDIDKLQSVQNKFFQPEEKQTSKKPMPISVCEILDIYGCHGEQRLTFLCQIRIKRQRRSRPVEFVIVGQLIDPSLRNDYMEYVASQSKNISMSIDAQQVNLVSPTTSNNDGDSFSESESSSDAQSLIFSNASINDSPNSLQYSPIERQLSKSVTPIDDNDEFWIKFFESTNDSPSCTANPFDNDCNNFISRPELTFETSLELCDIFPNVEDCLLFMNNIY